MKNSCSLQTSRRGGFPYRRSQASRQWLHFVYFSFNQDASVVWKTSGGLSGPFFHKDYLSSLFSTMLPHTTYNLRHLLTIVLSKSVPRDELFLVKLGQGNCFRKWLPAKKLHRAVWLGYNQKIRFLLLGQALSLSHCSYLDYRQETGYNDGAKNYLASDQKGWRLLCLSQSMALDSSAQLFDCMPACQTEHFATTSQPF